MAEVQIRRAVAGEGALLAELGRRTFAEAFAAQNDPQCLARFLDQAYTPAQQEAELQDPACSTLIAQVDGVAAGFALLRRGPAEPCVSGPGPVELQRIYALEAFWGCGVGRALLEACLDLARREGFRTLWLGVWEHNARAQAFYRRQGFRLVGSHPFDVGGDLQTDLIFERALD